MEKRRRIILSVLLLLSIVNYSQIGKKSEIRTVEFLSIFVIGFIAGSLIFNVINFIKSKK